MAKTLATGKRVWTVDFQIKMMNRIISDILRIIQLSTFHKEPSKCTPMPPRRLYFVAHFREVFVQKFASTNHRRETLRTFPCGNSNVINFRQKKQPTSAMTTK